MKAELGALAKLAFPLALAQVGLMAMGFVDVAIVGRLGAVPLAAVGLGNGIFFTISVIGQGAMMGLDPLISQALGAKEPATARALYWQGLYLAVAVGLVLSLPIVLVPLFLEPFGIAADIAREARSYVWFRLLSLVPMLAFIAARSYLQANRVTWPMVVGVIVANLANYVLDVTFVFGGAELPWVGEHLAFIPSMGAAGAAIATVVCTVLQFGFLVVGVRALRVDGFTREQRRMDRVHLKKALAVGSPVGLQLGAEVAVFALAGLLAARIGATAGAAHQVALTLASISFCVAVGVASAGAVRVGHAVGAGDLEGTRRAGLTAFFAGGGFMTLSSVVFLVQPRWLASTLTDKPEILEAAVPLLAVAAAFQISDGLQAVGSGVLRGAGDTRFAFVANVIGHYVVGLPIALVAGIALEMGVTGLWWGLAAGLTAVAAALFARFVRLSARPIVRVEADVVSHG